MRKTSGENSNVAGRYKALFNAMDEGYVLVQMQEGTAGRAGDLLYLEANPAAERMAGSTLEGRLGSLLPFVFGAQVHDIFDRVDHTGNAERHVLLQEDGLTCFNVYFFRVSMEEHTVAALYRDITDSRRAERKIKEDSTMILGIANAAPDMLYVLDIRTQTIVYANERALSLFGKTIEQIKALGPLLFDEIVYPDDRQKFNELTQALMDDEANIVHELVFRLVDNSGGLHWIRTRRVVCRRDEAGKPLHVLGISQDITVQVKLKEKNRKLAREQRTMEEQQARELMSVSLNAQEEERKRIAESLHNGLGQLLYGVKISLDQMQFEAVKDQEQYIRLHRETERLLAEAIRESRRISHELMPTILEDFGLKAALKSICEQYDQKIECDFSLRGRGNTLDRYLQIAIYRIMQELMLNVVKHSDADKARVIADINSRRIQLTVEDNGKGFDFNAAKQHGMGLQTIASKIKMLNGSLDIRSDAKGTHVLVTIPHKSS